MSHEWRIGIDPSLTGTGSASAVVRGRTGGYLRFLGEDAGTALPENVGGPTAGLADTAAAGAGAHPLAERRNGFGGQLRSGLPGPEPFLSRLQETLWPVAVFPSARGQAPSRFASTGSDERWHVIGFDVESNPDQCGRDHW